jgi:hypothetical protein
MHGEYKVKFHFPLLNIECQVTFAPSCITVTTQLSKDLIKSPPTFFNFLCVQMLTYKEHLYKFFIFKILIYIFNFV